MSEGLDVDEETSESSEHPYPPFELANRVLQLGSDDLGGYISYETAGRDTRRELLRLLPEGTALEGKRLLDFGCGAGRTLRQFLPESRSGEVWGVDIDRRSIDWIRDNLPSSMRVATCEVDPPLPFESGSVDLAWAISVFTHLMDNSAQWLLELHRVLRPGGLLMASYMGRWNSEVLAGEPWDEDRIGMNPVQHTRSWDDGGPMIFMSDWWVREHWGRAFEIVGKTDNVYNQTWVMLRKRDVTLTPEELLEPGDDPREWRALRHNVTQLQREVELAGGDGGEARSAAATMDAYESSLSWRVTAPLRALTARLRGARR